MANYSDNERLETLATLDANGGNVSRTARLTGIPRKTIEEWRNGRVSPDVATLRQGKKLDLAERLEQLAHQIVDLLPDKLGEASLRDASVALGIAVDKMQVLRGEPNTISAKADLTEDECKSRLAELLGRGSVEPHPITAAHRTGRGEGPAGAAHGPEPFTH